MNCEKFESTIIDELYDELDELTSAAARRHVAGCSRCSSIFTGLRATRRVALLPLVDPPADLEDRILAAARNAQKVLPLRGHVARAISAAGSWAMRPQTAMAALFLLMIGSSVLLLRGPSKAPSTSSVTVTAEGAPAQTIAGRSGGDMPKNDFAAAASAHGTLAANTAAAPKSADGALALNKDKEEKARVRSAPQEADDETRRIANAGPVAGVPNTLPPSATAAAVPTTTAAPDAREGESADFSGAMSLFHARRYGDALRAFDAIAASSPSAELYAAKSLKGLSGCSAAVKRFDALGTRAWGSNAGYDATLDAARCYREMGNVEVAKDRLRRLLAVPGYAAQAREVLSAIEGPAGPPAGRASPAPAPAINPAY